MSGHPALVDSLGLLSERAGDVTGLVYTRLFAAHPELEDLFLMVFKISIQINILNMESY